MRAVSSSIATALVAVAMTFLSPIATAAAEATNCGGVAATLVGTSGDDLLVGTADIDVIVALEGDDRVEGLGGDDVLCGGQGTDTLLGGSGADLLLGGLGAGVLSGGAGDDRLVGVLMTGADDQSVAGGQGRDHYFMRFVMQATATLNGVRGTVDLRQRLARVNAFGPTTMPVQGIEEVQVARGRWTLIGSDLDETLVGGTSRGASVVIHAGGGHDLLAGTLQDDLLDGGRGFDTVLASGGDDTCVSVERVFGGTC
jgi:Ca2+-binding RTX toxin-like protein